MAERTDLRCWMKRGIFVLLAFVIIVAQLVPLNMEPANWAPPDVLLAITLIWVVRKPQYVPVLVIAGLFLITDLLFQRTPGLWTALVVILTETIRRQSREVRSMPFLVEWTTMTIGIVAITVIYRLVLVIVMLTPAPLGLTLMQMIATILIYPVVVLLAHYIFGVSRSGPGDTGYRGQRI